MPRCHVLGLSHTRSTREYSACAFTTKVRNLCRMLVDQGFEAYHYGTEGSDPLCTHHYTVLDDHTFRRVHEAYDWRVSGFDVGRDNDAYRRFRDTAIARLKQTARPGDLLLCQFGWNHKEIAEALPGLIVVEPGIGYDHTFAPYRIWESYAWMHHAYGKEGRSLNPPWYDAVIPPAFDPAAFPYVADKEPFHLFVGRPTALKGRQIAIDACTRLGIPLYVAGQGERSVPAGVTHLGVLSRGEVAAWMGRASTVWAPTYYVEPGGYVAIEAQMCGTPVITTDMGCFTETVQHGITGYRCRTFEQFMWAAREVRYLLPADCRSWAESRYSLERVGRMYAEYFAMLARLHAPGGHGWYSLNPERRALDWLA